jgi:hypothetical protein
MSAARADSGAGWFVMLFSATYPSIYVDKIEKHRHVRIDVSMVST